MRSDFVCILQLNTSRIARNAETRHTGAMRVYLDDAELAGPISTLSGALEAAREAACQRGRVIVEAAADGSAIPDSDLQHPGQVAVQPRSVQFVSADPRAMVRAALLDAADLLEHARDDHAGVVSAIDAAEVENARVLLERVLGAWSACIATVRDGGTLVGIDLELPVDGEAPATRVARLSTTLIEVKRCLSSQDWAGLSDAVGDDLEGHARGWDAMLRAMSEGLR